VLHVATFGARTAPGRTRGPILTTAGATTDRARIPRHRLVFLAAGGLGLLLGMYTGLARAGIEHRFAGAEVHALAMTLGFLGTLIALERAVALGRRWGYVAPALNLVAVAALIVDAALAAVLFALAGTVVVATYLALLRVRVEPHLVVMALGAVGWVAACGWWLAGVGPVRVTPLLAAFVVLTIIGERLELSRLTLPGAASRRRLLVAVGLFGLGTVVAPVWREVGLVLGGVGLAGQVAWMLRYDIARRTVRRPGLPRFAATCMLTGYVWLAISAALWIAMGLGARGALLHDALVHALFLGFALSMVMGHAPIIVPAVLRVPLVFRPVAWLPLVLLQLSVAARVVADLVGSYAVREWALHGNVTALVVFAVVTYGTVRRSLRVPPAS
jgi:hypothetical protein